MTWLRSRLGDGERGSALVEFVFIALVVFVPLIYIVAGFSAVQRGVFASTDWSSTASRAARSARSWPLVGSGAVAIARPASRAAAVEANTPRWTAENPATM